MKHIDLNTSPDLPSSDASLEGATAGSMGGASKADVKRGYSDCNHSGYGMPVRDDEREAEKNTGFLNRPTGYER
jgi:hypothetical protein